MVKDCKKNRRGCMKNPLTNRWIKKDGETARNLKKHLSSLNEEGRAYKNGKGQYQNVPKHMFCGPAGGAPQGTFPVNTEKRCRAALSYAHNAPNPNGIRRCAVSIARKHKWECGTSSEKLRKSKICPSCGTKKCKCKFNGGRKKRRNRKKVRDCKKSHRGCMKNPLTNRWIKKDGNTARNLKRHLSSLNEEGRLYKNGKGQYQNVPRHMFCGPAGGAPKGTYPVNTEKRCRAALSYAHNAPNPDGIRRCAVSIARKHKWECGTSSEKLRKSKICPSCGNKKCKCKFGGGRRKRK